jgi:uncharacterized protein (DUF2252 family)
MEAVMSKKRKKFVISELKDYNKGIDKDTLKLKYCKMAATAYAFYRGTDHLYWADFSSEWGSKKFCSPKTKIWLQGDLHAYNFGTFTNDMGELVYGLNDFDEGVIADYQYDVWRMATSLILIARENGKSKKSDEKDLVWTFAQSYLKHLYRLCKNVQEKKVVYTTNQTISPLKDFMKEIDRKKAEARLKMLDKWTKDDRFDTSLEKLAEVSDEERKLIVEAIEGKDGEKSQYRKTLKGSLTKKKSKYFKVIDVAERLLAGTGSLGTKRYYVLLEGDKGKRDDDIILDIKHQGPASSFPYLDDEDRKINNFVNDAERTIEAYRALAVKPDDHLGWIELPALGDAPAGYYSVRERNPEKDAYPALVADLKKSMKHLSLKKKSNFLKKCKQWGKILATSHARADNTSSQDRIKYSFEKAVKKVTKGREEDFCKLVCTTAADYADQVADDYKYFTEWFDASDCPQL